MIWGERRTYLAALVGVHVCDFDFVVARGDQEMTCMMVTNVSSLYTSLLLFSPSQSLFARNSSAPSRT